MMKKEALLKIGELAKESGVSLRTIRYYHELGLIQPAERTEGNYRLFSRDTIPIIKLISNLKRLGLSLEEIKSILEPSSLTDNDYMTTLNRTRSILLTEKKNVEEKIEQYETLLAEVNISLKTIDNCFECRKVRGLKEPCKPECNNNKIHIKL